MQYFETIDETREFCVSADDIGKRLDIYLTGAAADFSRSYLKNLVGNGLVLVNKKASKPGYKLRANDTVTLQVPKPVSMDAAPEDIPLNIIYEDEHLIVINKNPGMVVHSAPGHVCGTLVNALLFHCGNLSGIGGTLRPGIVHRLDMDTSGCIVCAKSDLAQRSLSEQFSNRTVHKKYLTITHGVPRLRTGKVEGYIMRQAQDWQRLLFLPESSAGKYSLTYYKTVAEAGNFAFVECEIKTGRTHQIRLHMKSLGCPVLCDALYGREQSITAAALRSEKEKKTSADEPVLTRQALHAEYLAFTHPADGKQCEFHAPLPEDMGRTLAILGIGA